MGNRFLTGSQGNSVAERMVFSTNGPSLCGVIREGFLEEGTMKEKWQQASWAAGTASHGLRTLLWSFPGPGGEEGLVLTPVIGKETGVTYVTSLTSQSWDLHPSPPLPEGGPYLPARFPLPHSCPDGAVRDTHVRVSLFRDGEEQRRLDSLTPPSYINLISLF